MAVDMRAIRSNAYSDSRGNTYTYFYTKSHANAAMIAQWGTS